MADKSTARPQRSGGQVQRLERNSLSVPNAMALAAACMAPVVAVVLNAPAAGPQAGAALPLCFLVAFIAALFVGNTVIQFSRHLPSAGSFYTFNTHGLGKTAGFFTGWLLVAGYSLFVPGLFSATGAFAHDYWVRTWGNSPPWWIFSLVAVVLIVALAIRSIKASVRIDLTLLVLEILVFLVLAIVAIVKGGSGNTLHVFTPSASPNGLKGIGLGTIFGILSFAGFDAAATLGEETRDPRRNIPLAVGIALVGIGVFYMIAMYGLTAGYKLNNPTHLKAFLSDANPFVTLAHKDAPWLEQIVDLTAVIGLFSCFLATFNASVRILFSMGRDGVLPPILGRVHSKWYSPYTAILAIAGFTVLLGCGVGAWIGPGATGEYGFTGALGTTGIVLVYILACIALVRYFWGRSERNLFLHIILPICGVLALAYPLWSTAQPGQPFPYNLVPIIAVIWLVVGILVFAYLRTQSPGKIDAMGSVLAEEHLEEDRLAPSGPLTSPLGSE